MLMKLYDDLCVGIPSGIRIEGCVAGKYWTAVRANGNIGIARTLGEIEDPDKFAAGFLGGFLRDVGNHMRWTDLPTASVGVAALCAYYNTAERAKGLEGVWENGAPPLPFPASGKKIVLVGETGFAPSGAERLPLPMSPEPDERTKAALAAAGAVIVSADALTTRALPEILDAAGEAGTVALCGVGVPCSASFFAFGMPVRAIMGYYSRFPETVAAAALRDIADPAPGLLPFRVTPPEIERLHERKRAKRFSGTPCSA